MTAVEDHAKRLLDYMTETANDDRLWSGMMTQTFDKLDIPRRYYSPVLKMLKGSGAILQQQRGGGNAPSKWYVTDPDANPTTADIPQTLEKKRGIEERVADLEALVGGVNVAQAISDTLKEVRIGLRKEEHKDG